MRHVQSPSLARAAPADLGWLADFTDPPAAYRPLPFWSWNEAMQADEVERQVDLIAEAGWGGAFVHARVGLTIDYLGDAWFRAVDRVIARTRTRGLKVWLYDEDKWPSGFSGGTVPLADERFRMRALLARRDGQPLPQGATPLARGDGFAVCEWVATLGNPWFNGTSYSDLMNPDAVARFIHDAYESYHARYASEFGGEGQIVAEFTDEPSTAFRLGVPKGAIPYSSVLPDRFRAMHGYDPLPRLSLLFADGEGAERFRLDYYRTVNDLFERNFSQQIGEWCDARGIAMTGHYMAEHGLYDQQLWGVKIMPNYRHQHVPGIDFLVRQVGEVLPAKQCQSVVNQFGKRRMISELYGVSGQNLSFEDRWWMACQQIALGVNVLNPHLSLFTLAGCRKRDYPPNLFYQQPWWPMNAAIDVPLSRLCVAMSRGRYHAEALVLHPQESAFVSWRGEVDVANPAAHDLLDHEATPAGVKANLAALDATYKVLLDALLGAQRTFDLGDETILAQNAEIEPTVGDHPAMLRVGQSRYPVVIIPPTWTIAASTLSLLERFADLGGEILRAIDPAGDVVVRDARPRLDGEPSSRLDAFLAALPTFSLDQLPAALADCVSPAVRIDGGAAEVRRRVIAHVRDLDDASRLVFLINLGRFDAFNGEACFDGPWTAATTLDPFDGSRRATPSSIEPCGLRIDLTLAPAQSRLLHLTRAIDGKANTPPTERVSHLCEVAFDSDAWTIERIDDNAMPLDVARWREGNGDFSPRAIPVLAIQERLNALRYNGPVALRYGFRADGLAAGRKVHLVIEYPERYSIRVNDTPVAYSGLPAWRDVRWMPIDITTLVRDGENVVELVCDNFRHGDLTRTDDPIARYGTEIEAIYLVGDFGVSARVDAPAPPTPAWRTFGLPDAGARWLDPTSLALVEPVPLRVGDTTRQGLPFYAGSLRLRRSVSASSTPRRLTVSRHDAAVVSVTFDGQPIGTLVSRPFAIDLPTAAGEIELTLHGTLRNLLGPHHHPEGELAAVTPWHFSPKLPDIVADALAWSRGDFTVPEWDDRYCVVSFGAIA